MNNKYRCKSVKVGTFFSGIGSPEKAFQKLKDNKIIKDYEVMFFSEIDKNAIKSYCAVHGIDENLNISDIRKVKGNDLPYCDIWIGGFPCQDISCAGKMRGFDKDKETRSSLGWEMIRLLHEVKEKPNYVIFENVYSITSKRFKDTLNLFKNDLSKLGYSLYDNVLVATDFDIPQKRKRYFLVAILNSKEDFKFPVGESCNLKFKDMLEKNVADKYYLTDSNYTKNEEGHLIFNNNGRKYEIDIDKYYKGGICGNDYNTKFHQAQRIFSENGYAPTLTAANTQHNSKIVVSGDGNEN